MRRTSALAARREAILAAGLVGAGCIDDAGDPIGAALPTQSPSTAGIASAARS